MINDAVDAVLNTTLSYVFSLLL